MAVSPTHYAQPSEPALSRNDELLRGIQSNQRAAAGALIDHVSGPVNRLIWVLLGADSEHDDLVHEVLDLVLRHAHRVRDAAAFDGWVRTVTLNVVRGELRRRRWRRLFVPAELGLDELDNAVPDEQARERVRRVYRTLDSLSADQRTALVLRFIEGYELTEVADALGCSLATTKRLLQKAERRFAALHGEELGASP